MTVPALSSMLDPYLQAFTVGASDARRREGFLGPICRAKWNVAVRSEKAEPGRMALFPVGDREGRIVDFKWRSASATVTLMLDCAGEDLSGRTLTQVLGAGALRDGVFETCRRAFLSRSRQTADLNGATWRGRLEAHPWSAGLAAVLTSSSASERLIAAQLALRELERALRQDRGPTRPASARMPRVRIRS